MHDPGIFVLVIVLVLLAMALQWVGTVIDDWIQVVRERNHRKRWMYRWHRHRSNLRHTPTHRDLQAYRKVDSDFVEPVKAPQLGSLFVWTAVAVAVVALFLMLGELHEWGFWLVMFVILFLIVATWFFLVMSGWVVPKWAREEPDHKPAVVPLEDDPRLGPLG